MIKQIGAIKVVGEMNNTQTKKLSMQRINDIILISNWKLNKYLKFLDGLENRGKKGNMKYKQMVKKRLLK